MTESFYDLLGVSADADAGEIERAYRQRIKETHPDVNDDPDASAETARLVEARDVLTDEDERARYDRLGHDAYVGGDFESSTQPGAYWRGNDTTDAAESAANSSSSSSGPTNARAGAEERRRRERRARRDVDFGATEDRSSTGSGDGTRSNDGTASNDGTTKNDGSGIGGGTGTNGGTATAGAAASGSATGAAGTANVPPSWSDTTDGWAARSPASPEPGFATRVVTAVAEAPATAVTTFFLYPLLVVGTFFPPFPIFVNLIVGACLLASVAAVQSVAGLGVAIYGAWTVAGTVGLIAFGESPFSPLGLVVLGATWLPLGFSVLTYHVLDS